MIPNNIIAPTTKQAPGPIFIDSIKPTNPKKSADNFLRSMGLSPIITPEVVELPIS